MSAPIPHDETERLRACDLAAAVAEDDSILENLVSLGAGFFSAPICLVTIVESQRQRFIAKKGMDLLETSRDESFCAYTVLGDEVFVIEDATLDPRFADNAFVVGPPHIRFYAGAPLRTRAGSHIGSFSVIDTKPRRFAEADAAALKTMAATVAQTLMLRRELAEATESLSRVEVRAKKKALLLSQVSHELKTPLNQIVGFSEMMEAEMFGPLGSAKYRDYAGIVGRNARHLNDLVDAALVAGKASFGVGLETETVRLDVEVERVAEGFALTAQERAQTLSVGPLPPLLVEADLTALRQIVTNLLSNACKYAPTGAVVRIVAATDARGERALLTVADDGAGIPETVLQRLGQPFVRANGLKAEGSGLGLNLSLTLAEAMGARLQIASSPRGAEITLSLPLARAAAAA